MSNIKKELIDFETHCFETGQLQVGELMSTAIMHIAGLEKERDASNSSFKVAVEVSKNLHLEINDLKGWESKFYKLESSMNARDPEQQAKGVRNFFRSRWPRISMGKSAIWEVDGILVDEFIKKLTDECKALKEQE
jgi:hypothetical protein